jgi:hypothetical protein
VLINFLCVVFNFLTKMYVQSMYMKCITNLILDLALLSNRITWSAIHQLSGLGFRTSLRASGHGSPRAYGKDYLSAYFDLAIHIWILSFKSHMLGHKWSITILIEHSSEKKKIWRGVLFQFSPNFFSIIFVRRQLFPDLRRRY